MSKRSIAVTLYGMKKERTFFTDIEGEKVGADDLLSMFYSRPVSYEEAVEFLTA